MMPSWLRSWSATAQALTVVMVAMAFAPAPVQAQEMEQSAEYPGPAEATLTYLNREIVTFRTAIGALTPQQRAERAYRRLTELQRDALEKPIELSPIEFAGQHGLLLSVGGQPLFGIALGDIDRERIADVNTTAAEAKDRLADAFAARIAQEKLPVLLRGLGLSGIGLVVLAALVWLVWRLRLRVSERFHTLVSERVRKATAQRFDWTRYGYAFTARLVQLATTFTILLLAYIWLAFALARFPVTQPLADRLNAFLITLVVDLGAKAATAVPGLVTAAVILLIAQALVQVTTNVFSAAEGGRITLPMIKPDTASATRRIIRIVIWGIGFAIAYPYIPGSDSAAFQGLSVLFGLMITLGSTGIVSQMMSGTVLVYSRALQVGEFVSTGDVEGVVTEMGAISTKLTTIRHEEVTIPNSVLVESTIKNYSRQFGGKAALLSTKITIGYDTPWRQVHAILLMAAGRADGLRSEPKPYVVQRALTDFYVEYELFALTDRPRDQLAILSQLHSRIQDVFNEYGVQIMSPQYYEQPPQPLVVPKEKWFTAPATQEPEVTAAKTGAVAAS